MRIKELTYKWMNWSVSGLQFDTDKKQLVGISDKLDKKVTISREPDRKGI